MGFFDNKEEELFYPNCKAVEGSTEDRLVLECQPKLIRGGKALTGDRPSRLIIEANRKAVIIDDGGIPTIMQDKLLHNIETKRLDKN